MVDSMVGCFFFATRLPVAFFLIGISPHGAQECAAARIATPGVAGRCA
jgi:hypothetical protein